MTEREHLTAAEASALIGVSPKRLRQRMHGPVREGTHDARPAGIRARFFRSALVRWLEGKERAVAAPRPPAAPAPRPRSTVNPDLLPAPVRAQMQH